MSLTLPPSAGSAGLLLGVQHPRISHVPEHVTSAGVEAIELAARAGLHLDPGQQFVLMGALGEREDGKWAAFEVGVDEPRQNGKGSILETREISGALLFGEKLIIHSAHEQATSSEHFLRLLALIEESGFSHRMSRPIRGKGSEAILFHDGTRILFKTRTGGGGRGLTGDLVVLDEAMILPEASVAALVPTMAARSVVGNPQLWYAGSAVDQTKHEHGVAFARVRERGIAQAARVAWFEWSVEGDNPDEVPEEVRTDPESWAQANPGMGRRISEEHISNECGGALGRREFCVERLGIGDWPATDGSGDGLDMDAWNACLDPDSVMLDPICLAFDVNPERTAGAIAAASYRPDGQLHVEVIDHRPGTKWIPARLRDLVGKHPCIGIKVDDKGPAGGLIADCTQLMLPIETVTAGVHAQSCGLLVDEVSTHTVHHGGQPELDAAVRGARKRPLGDSWAWARKTSNVDISPLVSVTLALKGAVDAGQAGGGFEW